MSHRLSHDAMLTGILKMAELPPQCTFWRFLASLHLGVERQLLVVQQRMRERVWEAAHVKLGAITLDTDTTVHFRDQTGGVELMELKALMKPAGFSLHDRIGLPNTVVLRPARRGKKLSLHKLQDQFCSSNPVRESSSISGSFPAT
jgi:hypothetical protein